MERGFMGNDKVNKKYLLVRINEKEARNGKKYLDMTLTDGEKYINGKLWNSMKLKHKNSQKYENLLNNEGIVLHVIGTRDTYKGQEQIILNRFEILENEDIENYLPVTERDFQKMNDEFNLLVDSIQDKKIKKLIKLIYDKNMKEKFFKAPAAISYHHNYIGGLLEHTLQIAKLANKVVEVYGNEYIDRDILIAGVLLHDIGKVYEYENDLGNINKTDEGKLVGHIVKGSEIVEKYSSQVEIQEEKKNKIKHIILSHHGEREFGAAVLPKTTEAFLVHMIDNIDAKMKKLSELKKENIEKLDWSNYERMFNTEIYLK